LPDINYEASNNREEYIVDYTGKFEDEDLKEGVWVGYYLSTTPFEYIGKFECFTAKVVVVQVCQTLLKMKLNNVLAHFFCFESYVLNLVMFTNLNCIYT
jgi:hypothetical protein